MTFLLDVNVLIALLDPDHVAHDRTHDWFERSGFDNWATCPLTENGVIRIAGAASYTDPPLGCLRVIDSVRDLCEAPGHHFWPDDLSLIDSPHVDPSRLLTSSHITDTYLLALAVAHGGKLATLDRRLSPVAVRGGAEALVIIR